MIILYTKKGCPFCDGVRELLNEKKVIFEEREVLSNPKYYQELVEKSGQQLTPTLDIDGEIIPDSDRDEVFAYLKKKDTPGF